MDAPRPGRHRRGPPTTAGSTCTTARIRTSRPSGAAAERRHEREDAVRSDQPDRDEYAPANPEADGYGSAIAILSHITPQPRAEVVRINAAIAPPPVAETQPLGGPCPDRQPTGGIGRTRRSRPMWVAARDRPIHPPPTLARDRGAGQCRSMAWPSSSIQIWLSVVVPRLQRLRWPKDLLHHERLPDARARRQGRNDLGATHRSRSRRRVDRLDGTLSRGAMLLVRCWLYHRGTVAARF